MSETEIDDKLSQSITIFKYLEDKDIFQRASILDLILKKQLPTSKLKGERKKKFVGFLIVRFFFSVLPKDVG